MFLSLLEKAFKASHHLTATNKGKTVIISITITVYEAKQGIYPKSEMEWSSYDGILLPGSFSSAYENDEWIQKLKCVIQSEIHTKGRKTLAVCFGHQIFAHSFHITKHGDDESSNIDNDSGGLATPCPRGLQVGWRGFTTESEWIKPQSESSSRECLSMLYTHGDMVHSLPKHCAVSLGGTDTVPIQAAAYFAHVEECNEKESEIQVSKIDGMQAKTQAKMRQPYAFTFQGHPEYATDIGIQTFTNILKNMEDNDKLEQEASMNARKDALESLQSVESDCVKLMKVVGDAFGWMDVDAKANANAKG